jgi:hypothetical protein
LHNIGTEVLREPRLELYFDNLKVIELSQNNHRTQPENLKVYQSEMKEGFTLLYPTEYRKFGYQIDKKVETGQYKVAYRLFGANLPELLTGHIIINIKA